MGLFQFSRQVGQVDGGVALLEKRGDVNDECHEVRVGVEAEELAETIHRVEYRGARILTLEVEPDVEKNSGAKDELSSPLKPLIDWQMPLLRHVLRAQVWPSANASAPPP
jgi:hypothetical protein